MKRFYKKLYIPLIAMLLLFLSGCSGREERYTAVDTAMGTVVSQTVYGKTDVTPQIKELLDQLEADELSWRIAGSEIAVVNDAAGNGEKTAISDKLKEDLTVLLEVSEKSGGAFDVTIGPVVRLWGIDAWAAGENADASVPEKQEIAEALAHTGYEQVELTESGIILPEGMSLDLGAAGKGIACDRIAEYLEAEEVSGAVISVGGSVLTFGEKPDKTAWQIAVINPFDTSARLGVLTLTGQWCVSTSGDYERYVEVDGVRYYHILDPATGYPAVSGVRSVTIVCKSGILSDALSTACFVLGTEKGMELAEYFGVEALFVDENGELTMTDGMKKIWKGEENAEKTGSIGETDYQMGKTDTADGR